jgi:4a-hydroxytetrahydrobiopterin dehydratase
MTLGWVEKDNSLYRKFEFTNFVEAFQFMTKVAVIAEEQDHHPDWSNSWNTVTVCLSTHSMKALTDLDITMARAMDQFLLEVLGQ